MIELETTPVGWSPDPKSLVQAIGETIQQVKTKAKVRLD